MQDDHLGAGGFAADGVRDLHEFRRILRAYAFADFIALYGKDIVEAGCWAHVPRKFYDLTQAGSPTRAEETSQQVVALYAIEADI